MKHAVGLLACSGVLSLLVALQGCGSSSNSVLNGPSARDGGAGGSGQGGKGSGGTPSTSGSTGSGGSGPSTTCRNSLDCSSSAPICNKASGKCVECVGAADCTTSADCIGGACVPFTPCKNSLDCQGQGICDKVRGRCVECVANADCSGGDVCAGGKCRLPCNSDTKCTPLGLLCDIAAGHCVECVSRSDCGAGLDCIGGSCTGCVPRTCALTECGTIDDGCGNPLTCPACTPPATCGAVTPNQCGTASCTPRTCAQVGTACGTLSDACTSTIACACAGTGVCVSGTCCTPAMTCGASQCGTVSDGCTGQLSCPPCSGPCADGAKNGTETDIDCGGASCQGCALGKACGTNTDCLSGSCVGSVCTTPSGCTPTADRTEVCDGLDNDCDGTADNPGACSPNCVGASFQGGAYMLCKTATGWLAAEASCAQRGMHLARIESSAENDWTKQLLSTNSVVNSWIGASDRAAEGSWRWLGGDRFWIGEATGATDSGRFANWAAGEPNNSKVNSLAGEDCAEVKAAGWNDYHCDAANPYLCERYTVPAGCFDGVRNGTETDVDCGGSCGTCPLGSGCANTTDCDTTVCTNSVCASTCTDAVKDGAETDIDCGGTCGGCAAGKTCAVTSDCSGGTCTSGKCTGCAAANCPACSVATSAKCCTAAGVCGCSVLLIGTCM